LEFQDAPEVVNDPDLADGMGTNWPKGVVAEHVTRFMRSSSAKIDIIVTFDQNGVSSHPNHISTYEGCRQVLQDKLFSLEKVLCLQTVNILRKYSGYCDIMVLTPMDYNLFSLDPRPTYHALSLHHTQFVWFRKLFILFSRYTFANSFDVLKQSETKVNY
jgi:N-acetylglucosaminylphosphatidylinositol deacetylase